MNTDQAFALTVDHGRRESVVHVEGEVDLVTSPRLASCVEHLVEEGVRRVVLDLSAMTYIDSTGLRAVVRSVNAVRAHSGDIVIRGANRSTRKLMRITNLEKVVSIED